MNRRRPGETESDVRDPDTVPFEAVSERTLSDQRRPDKSRPDKSRPDQSRPDQSRPDQSRPDQSRPDQSRPDPALSETAVFESPMLDSDTMVFESVPEQTAVFRVQSGPNASAEVEPDQAADGYRRAGPDGYHLDDPDGFEVDGYDYEDDEDDEDEELEESPMSSRRRGPLIVLGVFATIIFGGGYLLYRSFFGVPDYDGAGQGDVIVEVKDGDTISAIGGTLTKLDVVRSQKAFTRAAADDERRARSVQPGYYRLRQQMSGESAVKALLEPRSRVGQLEIKGGVQLDDTRGPDGTVAAGVLTQIAQATCTQVNGTSTCISAGQLRDTMAKASPQALGVPDWARAEVAKAEPNRRLEGLVAPGRYDVRPGSSAEEVLRGLVTRSATQYEASGLANGSTQSRYTPYQLLVIASLVEKEGTTGDFEKVSGVIYNRLTQRVRLELDSTVNYPLDLQAVRTTSADRGRAGPYNSYANYGLPPTPIGAPGSKAIEAALRPQAGPWLFFVKCRNDGTSCFATTLAEHQANVKAAQDAGVY